MFHTGHFGSWGIGSSMFLSLNFIFWTMNDIEIFWHHLWARLQREASPWLLRWVPFFGGIVMMRMMATASNLSSMVCSNSLYRFCTKFLWFRAPYFLRLVICTTLDLAFLVRMIFQFLFLSYATTMIGAGNFLYRPFRLSIISICHPGPSSSFNFFNYQLRVTMPWRVLGSLLCMQQVLRAAVKYAIFMSRDF